jgi:class 3 adenylate cyclase/plastocyanin
MEHEVSIPKDLGSLTGTYYFETGFVEVRPNDTIIWTNNDGRAHKIASGDATLSNPDHIFQSTILNPGEWFSFTFRNFFESIPYFCLFHSNERGIVTMTKKSSEETSPREEKEHLKKVFQFVEGNDTSVRATVGPYFDPAILSEISQSKEPALYVRSVAIVFWDISGFSLLTENLRQAPHLLLGFLQEYFAESIRIVHEHDGIVDKFLGDGIMAYFGRNDNDTGLRGSVNAVKAALELRESFSKTKSKWWEIWKAKTRQIGNISLKCGINTGEVIIGEINAAGMKQFTLFGSPVNLASRLESEAEGGQIIVSHNTNKLLNGLFKTNKIDLRKRKIKAFEHISEYYEISNGRADPINPMSSS